MYLCIVTITDYISSVYEKLHVRFLLSNSTSDEGKYEFNLKSISQDLINRLKLNECSYLKCKMQKKVCEEVI